VFASQPAQAVGFAAQHQRDIALEVDRIQRSLRFAGEAQASLYAIDLKGNVALVLGGEADGLRRLTREHCDQLVKIPMPGTTESLNVSVATGVTLFEAVRQRQA
jgi:tRNA G18 (ribose-2'-O)-methylase SpoU